MSSVKMVVCEESWVSGRELFVTRLLRKLLRKLDFLRTLQSLPVRKIPRANSEHLNLIACECVRTVRVYVQHVYSLYKNMFPVHPRNTIMFMKLKRPNTTTRKATIARIIVLLFS